MSRKVLAFKRREPGGLWWRWRFIDRPRFKAQLQFEPGDLWLGVFWRFGFDRRIFHLYICAVPMLPVHFTILWRLEEF